jgi:hypothetical protein
MDIIEQRGKDYGSPESNLGRTAALWSAYLGTEITPEQVAVCMALVKVSRMAASFKADNYVDAKAYLEIAERLGKQ